MRALLFALLLVPSLVSADVLPTRTLEPVVRMLLIRKATTGL